MEILFEEGRWQVVREQAILPDGSKHSEVRVSRPDIVCVLPFITDDKIVVIREYRPFYGEWIWKLPDGKMDKELDLLEAAQRELREETGYRSNDLRHYCETNLSESIIFTSHYFIGRDLEKDPLPSDEDELIEVHEMTIEEAIDKVQGSPCVHVGSAYVLLRYAKEQL